MRLGECSACAACCKFLLLNVNPAYMGADKRRWIELHGIRLFEQGGGVWAMINATCRHLTNEGRCGVFGTPERPQACEDFPFVQSDIDLVDRKYGKGTCSYSFQEVSV